MDSVEAYPCNVAFPQLTGANANTPDPAQDEITHSSSRCLCESTIVAVVSGYSKSATSPSSSRCGMLGSTIQSATKWL